MASKIEIKDWKAQGGSAHPESKNLYITMEVCMMKWTCSVCGYEYDPAAGDPDNGIAPGTAFEDLPEDWVCPVCGVEKGSFEKE